MKLSKLSILLLGALLIVGCNTGGSPESTENSDAPDENVSDVYKDGEGVWAKENFDLLALSDLVEDVDDAAGFEKMINRNGSVNNLDLNGDGFVDYISVEEFKDRTDDQRGFTLFSRFGANEIQEVASIIFGRDRPDRRGAMLYVRGNEQIYGDDRYYEGNWFDKSLRIADWAFGDRNDYYRSPYYHDKYPDDYREYRVVETSRYRERITKYQVNPAMTKITTPTSKIKIKSAYPGRSYRRAHPKMAKPTREQLVFYKNKSARKDSAKEKKERGKSAGKEVKRTGKPGAAKKPAKTERKKGGKPPVQKKNAGKKNTSGKGPKNKGGGKGGKPGKK